MKKEREGVITACMTDEEVNELKCHHLDGGTIQYHTGMRWEDCKSDPAWYEYTPYRKKPQPVKKTVPMDHATCPDLPWGVRKPEWPMGEYNLVCEVGNIGVSLIGWSGICTWECLMENGWYTYEGRDKPSRPCSVDVAE